MDWLDAMTAALAIIAVPLAFRYSVRTNEDSGVETAACDCATSTETKAAEPANRQDFPQEEEPTQERQPNPLQRPDDRY
jgi:hypothetical protein